MSQNDIIIRTHYKSPHRLHIDSDIPTPSSEPINKFARQLITLLDTSDLSSMLSYCVIQDFTANCRKISQNCYSTALFTINFATSPIHAENILITLHYKKISFPYYWKPRLLKLTICEAYWIILNRNS